MDAGATPATCRLRDWSDIANSVQALCCCGHMQMTKAVLLPAGNLLKPMLGRGELRCIGATTLDEFRKYIGEGLLCPFKSAHTVYLPVGKPLDDVWAVAGRAAFLRSMLHLPSSTNPVQRRIRPWNVASSRCWSPSRLL